ncbi:MAG: type II secretion system GspH family protein, partial [Fuerstiella sp.]|nr:type II secretion system GspH family protein [Fuerstiella sp.]
MRTQTKTGHQHRTAFTLLELLIVIVIISVLAALLFPVVSGIFINVGNKEVLAEFTQLESAIAAFNSEMGANPYSSIILSDPEAEWTGPSKARIRKIWPEFDFKNTDFDD